MDLDTVVEMVLHHPLGPYRALQETNSSQSVGNDESASKDAAIAAQIDQLKELQDYLYLMQIEELISYVALFMMSVAILIYLKRNQTQAFEGEIGASQKIILPCFEPIFWIMTVVSASIAIPTAALIIYYPGVGLVTAYSIYTHFSGRQFIALLVVFLMYQKSVTTRAILVAIALSLFFSCYSFYSHLLELAGVELVITKVIHNTFRGFLVLIHLVLFIKPPSRASKRVLWEFAAYALSYLALVYAYVTFIQEKKLKIAVKILIFVDFWCLFYPVFIWRVLRADTEYWRGFGNRAVALQHITKGKRRISDRISYEGLHVLIEMHRKYIIDFAHLKIGNKIGTGSNASVFSGNIRKVGPCAVKVYTPPEINEEQVAEFSNEAALCGALMHPNIVNFHGMCVYPPTICLVFELCQGSLDDVLHSSKNLMKQHPKRMQFEISLCYMLDAARALNYLHSFTPPFIHRDIKPANFLVCDNGVVKLTDFGESRSLPTPSSKQLEVESTNNIMITITENEILSSPTSQRTEALLQTLPSKATPSMTVRGTVDYMAPEVINGRSGKAKYGELADIYSLAITMWEILNPGREKYSEGSHLQIYEWVLEGKRPPLDTIMPLKLKRLIENSWNADVMARPSSKELVKSLEEIQEECYATFANSLYKYIQFHERKKYKGKSFSNVFVGEDLVQYMIRNKLVCNKGEAVRIGNALMDCGFIHHVKHQFAFEDSEELFIVDEDKVSLFLPLNGNDDTRVSHSTAERCDNESVSTSTSHSDGTWNTSAFATEANGECSCRQFAQGFGRQCIKKWRKGKKSGSIFRSKMTTDLFPCKEEEEEP